MKYSFKVEGEDGDREMINDYINAPSAFMFIEEFQNYLRSINKYTPDGWSEDKITLAQEIYDKWFELKADMKD